MTINATCGIVVVAILAGITAVATRAADEIRAGKWQFTTQMQLPAMSQATPGAPPPSAANQPMTRTACINPANPIPAEAQCKLENVKRNGSLVTWAMTCNSPQGPIPSTGSARFAGDTMEATLSARIPGPNGQPVEAPGRITGRYLGPCDSR